MKQPKKILIVASAEDDTLSMPINDSFVAGLNKKLGGEPHIEWCNYHDIRFEIQDGVLSAYRQSEQQPLDTYDFIYVKSYFRYHEQAAVLASYARSRNVPYVCSELDSYMPMTKLTQFARMVEAKLPVIDTIYVSNEHYEPAYEALAHQLGSPFIFKSTDGHGGEENYLVHSVDTIRKAVHAFPELHFIAQKYVENDCDYRVLIVGGEIKLIIKRTRIADSHLNNTSQGGAADLVDLQSLPKEQQELCLRTAQVMGRETAGVDLMIERHTGKPYILEVNASPQIGSGAFVEEKLEIFCEYFKNVVE